MIFILPHRKSRLEMRKRHNMLLQQLLWKPDKIGDFKSKLNRLRDELDFYLTVEIIFITKYLKAIYWKVETAFKVATKVFYDQGLAEFAGLDE